MAVSHEPWGKFDTKAGTSHHLAHHCADVAACFLAISRQPVFKNRLEKAAGRSLTDGDLQRLAMLVYLHDAGKLYPGFQAKCWPAGVWSGHTCGHVQECLEIYGSRGHPAAKALLVDDLNCWALSPDLLRAIVSHHGRPAPPDEDLRLPERIRLLWRRAGDYDPQVAAIQLGAMARAWFPAAFQAGGEPFPDVPAFEHLMCGLTALADWVGSDVRSFPHVGPLDQRYFAVAAQQADEVVRRIGLDTLAQRAARTSPATFFEISGHTTPNGQQKLISETDLSAHVVILEAETGSGKTEAALLRYNQLFEAGRVDGLYFAVPTRAAAAQLHGRVVKAATRLFGTASPEPVLAVPGYIRAGVAEAQSLPDWKVRWDDDPNESRIAARWAAEHATRFLAAQIAVGTVDQAMLGALKFKHAHLRAASLSRSLLVIDEVHASDRYMTAIQKRLLDAHTAVGGYAMLMSATLGSTARTQWLKRPAVTYHEAVAAPYPAVWTNLQSAPMASPTTIVGRPKCVTMQPHATMDAHVTATLALEAARNGARVLVIRNTVTRAAETLQALEALAEAGDQYLLFKLDGVVTLHHSRFAPADRKRLDAAVERELNTDKQRIPAGRIVIGSQTLEQSLDIDADLLITDLCPVDVLLQRIGRLHRHALTRAPGFEQPRCIVLEPEAGLEPLLQPKFENGLGAWKSAGGLEGVYRDLCVLELTRALVAAHATWTIPDMNRQLVESATHPACIAALVVERGEAWKDYNNTLTGSVLAMGAQAQGMLIDRRDDFSKLAFANSDEERIRTRLGAEGLQIALPAPQPQGPFGQAVEEVVLPAHYSLGLIPDAPVIVSDVTADGFSFTVGDRLFGYDRFGIARVTR